MSTVTKRESTNQRRMRLAAAEVAPKVDEVDAAEFEAAMAIVLPDTPAQTVAAITKSGEMNLAAKMPRDTRRELRKALKDPAFAAREQAMYAEYLSTLEPLGDDDVSFTTAQKAAARGFARKLLMAEGV